MCGEDWGHDDCSICEEARINNHPVVGDLRARVAALEAAFKEVAIHDSWRCAYFQECYCGLHALCDKLNLPRTPIPAREDA